MWKRSSEGQSLVFHLAGINNQNFLMRDEQTGSFWQQVSGKCISGPLKGRQLEPVSSDELTFALWTQETPEGSVLAPDPAFAALYEAPDWEQKVGRMRSVVNFSDSPLPMRELVAGVELHGVSKAYPMSRLLEGAAIQDSVGGVPLLLVAGPDQLSVRAFIRRVPGGEADFYRQTGPDWALLDSSTSSHWDFRGCASDGHWKGKCLEPVSLLKDYWFDWHEYHPDTLVFRH